MPSRCCRRYASRLRGLFRVLADEGDQGRRAGDEFMVDVDARPDAQGVGHGASSVWWS